jgi:hypothetical protein
MAFRTFISFIGSSCDKCGKPGTPSDRLLCMVDSSELDEDYWYHEIRLCFECLDKIINQELEEKVSA